MRLPLAVYATRDELPLSPPRQRRMGSWLRGPKPIDLRATFRLSHPIGPASPRRSLAALEAFDSTPNAAMEWADTATHQIGFPDGGHGVPAVHSRGPGFHGGGPHGAASH
jgi:hypothetical protein